MNYFRNTFFIIKINADFLLHPITSLQILVLVCLLMARFGRDGHIFQFGSNNTHFMGVGTCVGYAIIVPAVLCTYLLGSNLTFLVRH